MNRYRLLCLVSSVLPSLAAANDLVSVYQMALKNDSVILAARHERDAAIQAEPKARALLLPQVTASYTEQFNDSKIDVTYTDPTTGLAVPFNRKNNGSDSSLGIELKQPLFDLEHWYLLKQASEQAALAELNYRAREQALLLRVTESYLGLLSAHDRLRTAKAEESALRQQLDLANENLAVGLSSITDVQDVQARYDLSAANALAAKEGVTLARLKLEQITQSPLSGIDGNGVRVVPLEAEDPDSLKLASLREGFTLPRPQPATVESWIEFASQGNFDVLAAKLNFNIAQRGVEAAWSHHLPVLAATANYTDSRTGGGTFPTKLNGPSVAVGVTVPLFSGGATQAQVRQSTETREQRLAEYDTVQRQAASDARTAWQGVITGAARVAALQRAVTSSHSALEANETGLSIGTRSAIDVLNTRQQSYGAQRDYEQARYDYLLSVLKLRAAAGRLSAKDLEEIDTLLAPR